jgi:nicotinate-nucleotide adenylyltransferase
MRIGVFGGTFDPPHLGHLVVAQEVYHRLGLDRVLWVPAAIPPHKQDQQITPGQLRLEMVRAAIAGDERFEASDVELRREGPSWTVDTLRHVVATRSDAVLFLIVGADQLAEFETWREPQEIRRLASVVGVARSGDVPAAEGDMQIVQVPRLDISSTDLRTRAREGEPLTYLVPPKVEMIIRREHLYGS